MFFGGVGFLVVQIFRFGLGSLGGAIALLVFPGVCALVAGCGLGWWYVPRLQLQLCARVPVRARCRLSSASFDRRPASGCGWSVTVCLGVRAALQLRCSCPVLVRYWFRTGSVLVPYGVGTSAVLVRY